jgi:hypothetical protein
VLDVEPQRLVEQDGRAGFCGWHAGAYRLRHGRAGILDDAGEAPWSRYA